MESFQFCDMWLSQCSGIVGEVPLGRVQGGGEGEKLAEGSSADHLKVSKVWLLVPLPP